MTRTSTKKTSTKEGHIIIYSDGACSGNQFSNNKGGWGAVLKYGDSVKEIYGGEHNTTNQRMEIIACIKALEQMKTSSLPIVIYSDSAYLVNCMNQQWYKKWETNGWKNMKKKPVENRDLWEQLITLIKKYRIRFQKVEGHTGVELNERADQLARQGIDELP
jgi:ribonuclease HI